MIITYCDNCYNGECYECTNELLDVVSYLKSITIEVYGEIFDRWTEYVKENKKYKENINSISSRTRKRYR